MQHTNIKQPTVFLLLFVLICQFAHLSCQGQSSIEGKWSREKWVSVTGPSYANAIPFTVTIQMEADSLVIETSSAGAKDNKPSRRTFPANGQELTVRSDRKIVRKLQWLTDHTTLLLVSIYFRVEDETHIDFTREERFSLSADGKKLNLDKKSIETRSEDWHCTGIFVNNQN